MVFQVATRASFEKWPDDSSLERLWKYARLGNDVKYQR